MLATQISAAARELEIDADPSRVQTVQVAIDAAVVPEVLPFWKALLGYRQQGHEGVIDPFGRGPNVWFQQKSSSDAERQGRNRIHVESNPRE